MAKFSLLSEGKLNTKLRKNKNESFRLFSLNLKPSDMSGKNVCPFSTESCRKVCVGDNGHFSMHNGFTHKAQMRRTKLFFDNPTKFFTLLFADIAKAEKLAANKGQKAAIRLNAYSDLNFEKLSKRYMKVNIYQYFSNVFFYDYTKDLNKALNNTNVNYDITFSYNENIDIKTIPMLINKGINVAVIFEKLPETFMGIPVIDGDKDDNRFLDPAKVIVGLKFKGSKRKLFEAIAYGFCIPKVITENKSSLKVAV